MLESLIESYVLMYLLKDICYRSYILRRIGKVAPMLNYAHDEDIVVLEGRVANYPGLSPWRLGLNPRSVHLCWDRVALDGSSSVSIIP
jgi:hypothetical protein